MNLYNKNFNLLYIRLKQFINKKDLKNKFQPLNTITLIELKKLYM